MLFSLRRLKKIANIDHISDEKVIDALISLSFEVDKISKLNEISGIKFGNILEVKKNENADNLLICQVEFDDKIRQIQTAAKNVQKDKQVLAFVPGSTNGKITFEAKKLRGHISEGMLVSANELGFSTKLLSPELDQGVLVFDPIFDLKQDPLEILELSDLILDIKLLWNRPDANSYLVIAIELAAFFGTKLDLEFDKLNFDSKNKSNLEIFTEKNESKVAAIEIEKVPNLPLVDIFLLLKSGVKITDLSQNFANFVLIYTGQPSYFLQTNKNQNQIKLIYQDTKLAEIQNSFATFQFWNNDELILIPEIFQKPIEKDQNLYLIMPKFDSAKIRQINHNFNLTSPSARQLAKNYSQGTTLLSLIFLEFFLEKHGINFSLPINFDKNQFSQTPSINFGLEEVQNILGIELEQKDFQKINSILEKIYYNFNSDSFLAPFYRVDIEFFADYAADFLRFYGLEKLGNKKLAKVERSISVIDPKPIQLKTLGYFEANSFLLISQSENFNPLNLKTQTLTTYTSQEHTTIRYSLAWQLAKIIKYNVKRKMTDISLYETGSVSEKYQVFAMASTVYNLETLKYHLKILYSDNFSFKPAKSEFLNPSMSQFIYWNNILVGWVGQISEKYDYQNINFLEIIVSKIDLEHKNKPVKFEPYDNSQLKYRDITLSLEKNDIPDTYLDVIKKIPEIFSIKLKDYVIINNRQKITYRVTGTDKVCQEIDKFYK
ncbi:phenylalanine--tRNA ligase subunit beta [Mesomycoplasma ovipneumoniae]